MSTTATETIIVPPQKTEVVISPLATEIEAGFKNRYSKHHKADEKPPVDGEKPPVDPPKQHGDIRELRTAYDGTVAKLKESEVKLTELQTKLTDFEGTVKERDALKASITDLQSKVEAAKNIESVAALEMSEDFQNKYVKGEATALATLKELSENADITPDDLFAAMSKTGKEKWKALDEVLESAPSILKGEIVTALKALEALRADKNAALSKAAETMKSKMTERETTARQKREARSKAAKEAWDATSELAKEYGLDEKSITDAGKFYNENGDPKKAAEITVKGFAAEALKAQVAELKAEIARLTNANPGIEAGAKVGADGKRIPFRQQMLQDFNNLRR